MKTSLVLVVLGLGLSASAATMNHYDYSAHIPATQAGCKAEAQALASAFIKYDSKLQNVVGECISTSSMKENGKTFSIDSLAVQYDSTDEIPLLPFTADLQVDPLSSNMTNVYNSYQECLTDMTAQKATFVAQTGLSVLAASCESENGDPMFGYKMILSGLGQNKASLYVFENSAAESVATDSNWAGIIHGFLINHAAVIAKQVGETYYYYAANEVVMSSQTLITTATAADCQAQQAQATTLLQKLGAKSVVTACDKNDLGHTLDVVEDGGIASSDFGGSTKYSTFASCMSDLKHQQNLDAANGGSSIVRFCAVNDLNPSQYDIESFSTSY